jgi:hypothetical protein
MVLTSEESKMRGRWPRILWVGLKLIFPIKRRQRHPVYGSQNNKGQQNKSGLTGFVSSS